MSWGVAVAVLGPDPDCDRVGGVRTPPAPPFIGFPGKDIGIGRAAPGAGTAEYGDGGARADREGYMTGWA